MQERTVCDMARAYARANVGPLQAVLHVDERR